GDRAEGVADEAMRHAITKLANLHFPATQTSAERIIKMGEDPSRVHVVGSPAGDGLEAIDPANEDIFGELGMPECVVMMHPIGRDDDREYAAICQVLDAVGGKRTLVMHPNFDPGRQGIMRAIKECAGAFVVREHFPRDEFIGVLKRVASNGGALVGNSSAGLIECSIIGCPSVDIGDRQNGRERCDGWTAHANADTESIRSAVESICSQTDRGSGHPYGDGTSGVQIAQILATIDTSASRFTRKQCAY
ncbi:MAG: UDP-N-acetylglucosamine 2-epimerase, partial [Phycisphaerales bacterium]|nr:UDP-N-acetylglucosamine 2-epimerase [Phycisphaerales bacterium]